MSLAAWKMSFRATATRDLPRDLEHAIHWFPQARTVFADTLGFLLFWLELKFGPPRNTFLFEFKAACNEPNMRKRVFIAAQKVAISMSRNPPDDWLDDVGGPLKAHGYQMALQLIHAIEKDRNGKILLGRGREAFSAGNTDVLENDSSCIESGFCFLPSAWPCQGEWLLCSGLAYQVVIDPFYATTRSHGTACEA